MRSGLWLASLAVYGKGTHGDWAYEKIQRPSTFLAMARNLANYHLRIPRVYRFVSIVIEPVSGCNLRCKTCWGTLGLEGRRPALMDWEIYRKIVDQTPPTVETLTLSLYGEPLLHPRLCDMAAYSMDHGLRTILFTNGTLLTGERMERVARLPWSVVNVSVETDPETAKETRGIDLAELRGNIERFLAVKHASTEVKVSLVVHPGNRDRLDRFWPYWQDLIRHYKISGQLGVAGNDPAMICMEPWRGNINVYSNGDVSPCCVDWYNDLTVGNMAKQDLPEILNGPAFQDLLARFIEGKIPGRCVRCDECNTPGLPTRMPKKRHR